MACERCEHCQTPMYGDEAVFREGYTYHRRCCKCYVCSETDLSKAEVFKGVIFCNSCSSRIFHGCSTVKRVERERSRRGDVIFFSPPPVSSRRHRTRRVSGYRGSDGVSGYRGSDGVGGVTQRVLERCRNDASTDTSGCYSCDRATRSLSYRVAATRMDSRLLHPFNKKYSQREAIRNKDSVEVGVNTAFETRVLLKDINYRDIQTEIVKAKVRPQKSSVEEHVDDSGDLRMAELGASTELANMALRKKSERAVIITSRPYRQKYTKSTEETTDVTEEVTDNHANTDLETTTDNSAENYYFLTRSFRNVIKFPFRLFKQTILHRSSLISAALHEEEKNKPLYNRMKYMFINEIPRHQDRGVRRLFSAINRSQKRCRLGWPKIFSKSDCCVRYGDCEIHPKRCKHFYRSHSYRCMRRQAMRLAGPTKCDLRWYTRMLTTREPPRVDYYYDRDVCEPIQESSEEDPELCSQCSPPIPIKYRINKFSTSPK